MAGPDAAYLLQFETQYALKFQQKMSRLMDEVRVKQPTNSILTAFGILGPTDVVDITGQRHAATAWSDDPSSRRWAPKRDYQVAKMLDKQDDLSIILDLQMGYLENAMAGMERKEDKVIIDAVTATAASGTYGTDTVAYDTTAPAADGTGGNQIALGAGNLSPDKFRLARAIFDAREVGLDGLSMGMQEFVWVTSPKGHQDMMEFTEATTTDYLGVVLLPTGDIQQSRMPLVQGRIPYYMGFRIKISNQLNLSGANRINLAWHKNAMGFAGWGEDRRIWAGELPEHNLARGLLVQEHFGAVRIFDAGVLSILCDEL